PKDFKSSNKYPLVIALHDVKESAQSTLEKWRPVADDLGLIVVCPVGSDYQSGYTRKPTDDRKLFVQFKALSAQKYNINPKQVLLAGFSRGGNYAIETGIMYPDQFPLVVSLFGFFNESLQTTLTKNSSQQKYKNSRFYFLTGKGDATRKSLETGNALLKKLKIRSKLVVVDDLFHAYPSDLAQHTKNVLQEKF
ncbi:MAG: putative esterase, partial [Candidatus Marinamargulisbacteria bacterium]